MERNIVDGSELSSVEALPELKTLADDELRALIRELIAEEREVSYRRRLLHGKIDILRAELVGRLQRQVDGEGSLAGDVDLERLTEILASKAAPPGEDESLGEGSA